MKLLKNLGMIVLGIWLIATGLLPLLKIDVPASGTILAVLAIIAGILILLRPSALPKKLGLILLCVWLIAQGIWPLLGLSFAGGTLILNLLAILTGIVLLLGSNK
jgi:hypothetical protein